MTEKVKLTKAQVDGIDCLLNEFRIPKHEIVRHHSCNNGNGWKSKRGSAINNMPLDTLIHALYFGYEVFKETDEETDEEKVLRYLNDGFFNDFPSIPGAYKSGFCNALLALGREDLWKIAKDVEL